MWWRRRVIVMIPLIWKCLLSSPHKHHPSTRDTPPPLRNTEWIAANCCLVPPISFPPFLLSILTEWHLISYRLTSPRCISPLLRLKPPSNTRAWSFAVIGPLGLACIPIHHLKSVSLLSRLCWHHGRRSAAVCWQTCNTQRIQHLLKTINLLLLLLL